MKQDTSSALAKIYRWNRATLWLTLSSLYLYALVTCLLNRHYLFDNLAQKLAASVTMTLVLLFRYFPLWGGMALAIAALDYAALHKATLREAPAKRAELFLCVVLPVIVLTTGPRWEAAVLYAALVGPLCAGVAVKFRPRQHL
ncbi:hypothetical protein [Hymenobacter cellulosivorans]|uniref:Uncharacterized protein n=1 Tax=Hymenobacter cellulosivorans TaxID=2932249 RepID=A0ABY4FED5_9BACT|nr:hypothetical protein [Hymenobacter cellulosivorans]UOQ55041.1 hypothetical protein MUN80_09850 [Hymenobacter cellulosivorans]